MIQFFNIHFFFVTFVIIIINIYKRKRYNIKNNVQAPIKKGDKFGTLEIVSNDEIVATSEIVALEDIDSKGFFARLWSKFLLWLMSLFGIA